MVYLVENLDRLNILIVVISKSITKNVWPNGKPYLVNSLNLN